MPATCYTADQVLVEYLHGRNMLLLLLPRLPLGLQNNFPSVDLVLLLHSFFPRVPVRQEESVHHSRYDPDRRYSDTLSILSDTSPALPLLNFSIRQPLSVLPDLHHPAFYPLPAKSTHTDNCRSQNYLMPLPLLFLSVFSCDNMDLLV